MDGVFYSEISDTRIGWLNTLISTLDTAGELVNIDSLSITSTAGYTDASNKHKNAIQDIGFVGVNQYLAAITNIDFDGYHPAGLLDADRIATPVPSLLADKSDLMTDFISGVWLGANAVGATTISAQRGVRESASGGIILIRQNGSSQIEVFAASGSGLVNGAETRPANGFYGTVRDGGNIRLVKNDTVVASSSVAAVAMSPGTNIRTQSAANYNNNGTIQFRWAGLMKAHIFAKYTTMNKTTVMNAMTTFLNDWLTSAT
jgi:hypothetical protein